MARGRDAGDVSPGIEWDEKLKCFVMRVGQKSQPIDYKEIDGSSVKPKEK